MPEEAGRTEEALAVHAAMVEMQPTEATWRHNYTDSLIQFNQLGEAAARLDEAERLDRPAPYLALRRAELAKAHADHSTAAEWAQEALRRQPGWDEAQAIPTWATIEPNPPTPYPLDP